MKKIMLFLMALLLSTIVAAPTAIDNLFLCDRGTENLQDRATLCQGGDIYGIVRSTALLKSINKQPVLQDTQGHDKVVEGITFLYDAPGSGSQKQIQAIFTKTLDSSPITFPLDTFSSNVVQGQGLMLVYQGEYYRLQMAAEDLTETTLFSPGKLQLRHIPTENIFSTNLYTGTEQYYFEVLGEGRITIQISGTQVVIGTAAPGEAPASYVVPSDLAREYEVVFTKNTPVRITFQDLGTFTICRNDDSRDLQLVQVCRENDPAFTLPADVLTKRTVSVAINNGAATNYEVAFLFEVDAANNNLKKVSLFTITLLASAPRELLYGDFLDAMAEGRRAAVEFDGNIYLLAHPGRELFSLATITLRGALPGSTAAPLTASENFMEYPLANGGRLYLQRFYGDPPPPFQINALRNEELKPVDLQKELSVTLTSEGSRILSSQDADLTFGKIATRRTGSDPDVLYSDQTFKLTFGQTDINLNYHTPIERGNGKVLFYYKENNIQQGQTSPRKTAMAYRLYALQPDQLTAPTHSYGDIFIGNITMGKEIALKFPTSDPSKPAYYILGYQGGATATIRTVFSVGQLTLRHIDQVTSAIGTKDGRTTTFTVPEGKIIIEVDETPPARIIFQSTTSLALATILFPAEDYSIELDKNKHIKLWENGPILTLCDQGYESTEVAAICISQNNQESEIFIDGADLLTLQDNSFLLETNGETRNNKKVTIHRIIEPQSQSDPRDTSIFSPIISIADWAKFIQHLQDEDLPIFNLSSSKPEGTLYLPASDKDSLQDFKFKKYGSNSPLALRGWKELSPITGEGTFVLDNRVLFATQRVEGTGSARQVKTDFIFEPFYFLPENGERLLLNSTPPLPRTLSFITAVNGRKYDLTVENIFDEDGFLVQLSLTNTFQRLFGEKDIKRLPLDSLTAELEIINLTEERQQLSIKRLR